MLSMAITRAVTTDERAVLDCLKQRIAGYDEQRLSNTKQEISKLHRRIQELESINAKLYEDKYGGAISTEAFTVLVQKNKQLPFKIGWQSSENTWICLNWTGVPSTN